MYFRVMMKECTNISLRVQSCFDVFKLDVKEFLPSRHNSHKCFRPDFWQGLILSWQTLSEKKGNTVWRCLIDFELKQWSHLETLLTLHMSVSRNFNQVAHGKLFSFSFRLLGKCSYIYNWSTFVVNSRWLP